MRINGRTLRYSTLAERRMFKAVGIDAVRVPRSLNPYAVARQLSRLAKNQGLDAEMLAKLVARSKVQHPPVHGPGIDMPEPIVQGDACAA